MDVRNAAQAVDTAQKRVIASRAARESAEQQLAGEQKLYEVGRSTTFLLLQRQQELTDARTAELQSQTDYNKALADLQRATGSTLRVNNVVVENPTKPKKIARVVQFKGWHGRPAREATRKMRVPP